MGKFRLNFRFENKVQNFFFVKEFHLWILIPNGFAFSFLKAPGKFVCTFDSESLDWFWVFSAFLDAWFHFTSNATQKPFGFLFYLNKNFDISRLSSRWRSLSKSSLQLFPSNGKLVQTIFHNLQFNHPKETSLVSVNYQLRSCSLFRRRPRSHSSQSVKKKKRLKKSSKERGNLIFAVLSAALPNKSVRKLCIHETKLLFLFHQQ